MMKLKTAVTVGLLLVAGLMTGGCALFLIGAGAAAGAGAVVYLNGELKATGEVSLERGWAATQQTMSELQFRVTKTQKDALAGELVAQRADGTPIRVRLRRESETLTEFRIRVGTWGDENLSHLIYQKIHNRF